MKIKQLSWSLQVICIHFTTAGLGRSCPMLHIGSHASDRPWPAGGEGIFATDCDYVSCDAVHLSGIEDDGNSVDSNCICNRVQRLERIVKIRWTSAVIHDRCIVFVPVPRPSSSNSRSPIRHTDVPGKRWNWLKACFATVHNLNYSGTRCRGYPLHALHDSAISVCFLFFLTSVELDFSSKPDLGSTTESHDHRIWFWKPSGDYSGGSTETGVDYATIVHARR